MAWLKKGLVGILLAATLSSGCASYKIDTPNYIHPRETLAVEDYSIKERRKLAKEHFLYKFVPLSREQIEPYDIGHWVSWNLFGNEDDGIFGEYCVAKPFSKEIDFKSFLRWNMRNPLSNISKYTLGKKGKREINSFAIFKINDRFLFMQKDYKPYIFSESKASFNLSLNHYLPFLSFKFPVFLERRFDFYMGWRPDGSLGIKLRPFTDDGGW